MVILPILKTVFTYKMKHKLGVSVKKRDLETLNYVHLKKNNFFKLINFRVWEI